MSTCILWFRNNLRIGDNFPVAHAYSNYDLVIPVFVQHWSTDAVDSFGNPSLGVQRHAFLMQSIQSLKNTLQRHHSDLIILEGSPVENIKKLALELKADAIVGPKEVAWNEVEEERTLREWSKPLSIKCEFFMERTLFNQEDLPFTLDRLPLIFSKFRQKIEYRSSPAVPIEEPEITPFDASGLYSLHVEISAAPVDPRTAVPFIGGTESAWQQLDYYLWESKKVESYKQTRNELLGRDFSSKFSPFLSVGSISARQIYIELKNFEDEILSNDSTYWLYFELLWREFFHWTALKFGRDLFLPHGLQPGKEVKTGFHAPTYLKWKEGRTGDSFVDANMKELSRTGFMSNRGRQNVASYLIHDLGLDWRCGAAWFESQLIDYDPASNYGNWLYIAGLGNDPRPFRKFNTKGQSERYDPEGRYQSTWLG